MAAGRRSDKSVRYVHDHPAPISRRLSAARRRLRKANAEGDPELVKIRQRELHAALGDPRRRSA